MKLYTYEQSYTGLDGASKKKTLVFALERIGLIELKQKYDVDGKFDEKIRQLEEKQDMFTLLMMLKEILLTSYCEVDYENDLVDRTPATMDKFHKSVALAQLVEDMVRVDGVMGTVIEGIYSTVDFSEEEAAAIEADQKDLKARYLSKVTKSQNESKKPDTAEVVELRKRLAAIEGGQK